MPRPSKGEAAREWGSRLRVVVVYTVAWAVLSKARDKVPEAWGWVLIVFLIGGHYYQQPSDCVFKACKGMVVGELKRLVF